MNLFEYSQHDATALAALVNRGEVLPGELAQLALQAIEKFNPQLNAVIECYPERAQPSMDQQQGGAPLAGVPMLLKDTGTTDKGKEQSCGSRIGTGYIATADSYLTQYYKSAGLNILGRTTMPELAQAATTESALSGATVNPWDLSRSTGGSSGGAAAAVASGMVPVAHGSDTGGSIRIPAACCGLVGLKPSRGRISKGPALDETLYGGLNTEHVLTRSVRDCAVVLQISSRAGRGDPFTMAPPTHPYPQEMGAAVSPLRIAFTCNTHTGVPVDPVMVDAVKQIAGLLETLGHRVVEATPLIDGEYGRADTVVWAYSTAHEVERLSKATGNPIDDQHLERPTLEALEIARGLDLGDWFDAMGTYNRMCRTIGEFFQDYDLLLTPTVATLAPPLGTLNSNRNVSFEEFMQATTNFCPHTAPFNVTGQPAISLPLCTSAEGLPIGIQFVARYGGESTLIRLASQLEALMPWQQRLPPLHVSR